MSLDPGEFVAWDNFFVLNESVIEAIFYALDISLLNCNVCGTGLAPHTQNVIITGFGAPEKGMKGWHFIPTRVSIPCYE